MPLLAEDLAGSEEQCIAKDRGFRHLSKALLDRLIGSLHQQSRSQELLQGAQFETHLTGYGLHQKHQAVLRRPNYLRYQLFSLFCRCIVLGQQGRCDLSKPTSIKIGG